MRKMKSGTVMMEQAGQQTERLHKEVTEVKEIKIEWCENWIKAAFGKLPFENGGIEVGCFWKMAEKSGLWIRGTYGSPMSQALEKLVKMETVSRNGKFLYNVFRLA